MKQKLIIPATIILSVIVISSCFSPRMTDTPDQTDILPLLSAYAIFEGDPSSLVPQKEFIKYELATPLFSDYAEKQRLIKIPKGALIKVTGDLLPEFPDGTILAKTFFYYNDKRNPAKGKRLIETRLLIKNNLEWNAATYLWNNKQTDAVLSSSGATIPVAWTDENGEERKIIYHAPSGRECRTCHTYDKEIIPIGFKARNLNMSVNINNRSVNQLDYFHDQGIMNTVNPSSINALPAAQSSSYSLEQRVRAYLDMNCAHCHNPKGYCSQSDLSLGYEVLFEDTHIQVKKNRIVKFFENGRMPKIGTTMVDKEGLQLIRQYIKKI